MQARYLAFFILNKLPYVIGKLPYSIVLFFIKLIAVPFSIRIWARNSYTLNCLVPGMSDLDLTIIYTNNYPSSYLKILKLIKIFVPFLGETIVYNISDLGFISRNLNFFELKRDPNLLSIIKPNTNSVKGSINDSNTEKITFFIHQLISDRNDLIANPNLRIKKWTYNLKTLSLSSLNTLSSSNLISLLNSSFPFLDSLLISEFIFKNLTNDQSINDFYKNLAEEKIKLFICYFPFIWIGPSFFFDRFDYDRELIKFFTDEELLIFKSQIKWELWGLYTQINIISEKLTLLSHLNNIKSLCHHLNDNELNNDILFLESLIQI